MTPPQQTRVYVRREDALERGAAGRLSKMQVHVGGQEDDWRRGEQGSQKQQNEDEATGSGSGSAPPPAADGESTLSRGLEEMSGEGQGTSAPQEASRRAHEGRREQLRQMWSTWIQGWKKVK